MLKDILGIKEKKGAPPKPAKETKSKIVPAQRFNDMIEYYTNELKSRLAEIAALKAENEMLIKTSLRNASRSDELRLQVQKLQEDVRLLQDKLKGK
ncbi:hypothetical protein KY359_04420 [Candidatus Woesearchaeota archaeon]|nr:hypothetical protein [Candidatus Woesearchaeota archaeon]